MTDHRYIAFRKFVLANLVLFAVFGFVSHCAGCFPVDKQVEAAGGYAAQQAACIDKYADREHIDICRNRVKAAWAASDAGKDVPND